ncbi:hypothetical protein [Microseira wollei]|nr:hypothetical protein [Microseira wollei]
MRVGARQYRYFGLRLMIADAVPLQCDITDARRGTAISIFRFEVDDC